MYRALRFLCIFTLPLVSLLLAFLPGFGGVSHALSPHIRSIFSSSLRDQFTNDQLYGVTALAANDAWAVGYDTDGNQLNTGAIEHWNGTQWSTIHNPNPSGHIVPGLYAVTAETAANVWAVGSYNDSYSKVRQTLTEHWNGNKWRVISSPNVGYLDNVLNGVSVITASDIWAVGSYGTNANTSQGLIEHWDGKQWSVISSPTIGASSTLTGVAAISSSDVWAVGYYHGNSSPTQALIEQWNGTSWTIIPSPNPGLDAFLTGVAAISSNDVWAVGYIARDDVTLIEQWNGTSWNVVPSQNPGLDNSLFAVAALSMNDIWAVGSFLVGSGSTLTLIEHWDGTSWSVIPSPNENQSNYNLLWAIAGSATNSVWAVGYYVKQNNITGRTLTEYWNGVQWSIVHSPNLASK